MEPMGKPCRIRCGKYSSEKIHACIPGLRLGVRIRGTLGDIDPLNKVPFKRARSRVQKGYPLRGLPNDTT